MQNSTRILNVLTTSRNVRDFYAQNSAQNALLQKAITISEFENRAVLVRGLKMASDTDRLLIMQEAVKIVKKTEELGIRSEFFVFLKNSEYLFSFFKELKREKVAISSLKQSDIYANYDEHLEILSELEKVYCGLLKNRGFYDEISVCDSYEVNYQFVSNFDLIKIKIDGIFSKFSWEILEKIAQKCEIIINFTASVFNEKLINQISQITGLEFLNGGVYEVNLSKKIITNHHKMPANSNVKIKEFSIRSLQCVYVFDEISRFMRAGISPKNIAVILPDEDFCEVLQNLDENNMLNYAMSKNFKNESIFILLNTIKSALNANLKYEYNEEYLTQNKDLNPQLSALNFYNLKTQTYAKISQIYDKKCDFGEFENLIQEILNDQNLENQIRQIIEKQLFTLQNLLAANAIKFSEILEILLIKLSKEKIPFVGGGEVTAIGILESRSQTYDGVIIVDFNDNLVPRPSPKEMFLSSQVRSNAGLISHAERENLQRFYYDNLIRHAKMVSISYLSDEEHIISRFGIDFKKDENFAQESYLSAINRHKPSLNTALDEITQKHDFFGTPLSFSRLDTFLKCRRKYYYKYISKIPQYRNFGDKNDFGNIIHECLAKYFKTSPKNFDKEAFWALFEGYKSKINLFNFERFRFILPDFAKVQNEHFSQGYAVKECEKELQNEFCGVKIEGKIDRIDASPNGDLIIDYKSGKIDEKSLQLPFYQALYGECEVKFFDIFKAKFVDAQSSIDELKNQINALKNELGDEICFERTSKDCKFCDYKIFCKKELK